MFTPTMPMLAEQRRSLGAFLRTHREALTLDAAGPSLASFHDRRRTPGLRREEVAQLCGLSTTWYTWVEQGRDIALSAAALARLADALQLSAAERTYLFELARRRDPAPPATAGSAVPAPAPPELAAVLRVTTAPAYLLDRFWRACGWNEAAGQLFVHWFGSREACLLRYVFLDATARGFICDWENRARRLIAEFRADTAHRREEPGLQELVRGLQQASPCFARFWDAHAVLAREGGTRAFNHPQDGVLRYEQVTFAPAAHPGHKLVVLLPKEP